jgi:TolB protein
MMMQNFFRGPHTRAALTLGAAAIALATLGARQQPPQQTPTPAPQQPSEIGAVIKNAGNAPTRIGVPSFIALTNDAETTAIAKTIGSVLWDDINYEREFELIPRDASATIPPSKSFTDVPMDRWREIGADALIVGTVEKTGAGVRVQVRLFRVATGQSAFDREYSGSGANPRAYAHTISDEIHKQQRNLNGVARTKLAFDSDRDGERMGGTIEQRATKEIYIADYDGENQRRFTVNKSLNIMSAWSPDSSLLAYVSFRRGRGGNIFISNLRAGTLEDFSKDKGENWLPAWSPDGARVAFSSTRDGAGNTEIYVANRDGSNVHRLTQNQAADTSPTWSPSGTQIAFVSDRSGGPQLYIIGADGTGLTKLQIGESYVDRPTWSPPPFNEIAFAARTGAGFDIKVFDFTSGQVHALTFGEGTNESPAWSPNGRHLAFSSTRAGKAQIFTVGRDGKNVRQITRSGNNYQPAWSK